MREQSCAVRDFAIFSRFFAFFSRFFRDSTVERPAEGRPEAGPRAASPPGPPSRPKFFRSGLRVYNTYSCKPEITNLGRILETLWEFRSNLGLDLNSDLNFRFLEF